MNEIRVYGASDDLIELEGAINEEFSALGGDDTGGYLGFSDGTLLSVRYDDDGFWRVNRLVNGEALFAKTEAWDAEGDYSDRVTLTGEFRWVVYGNRYERVAP